MGEQEAENGATANGSAEKNDEPKFTLRQRIALALVSWAGRLAIRLVGPTLRYRVSIEEGGPPEFHIQPAVYAFWHRCIFPGTYYYRGRDIAVMTSASFDGEYIARIIESLGYRAVRGSSSRGGARALLAMRREIEAGRTAAFTMDGPRGPRYVAKPGAAVLARSSGAPLMAFHLAVERAWVLDSWDAFIIPKPRSRVLLRIGKLIRVPAEADDAALERAQQELQATLDRLREYAEANVSAS